MRDGAGQAVFFPGWGFSGAVIGLWTDGPHSWWWPAPEVPACDMVGALEEAVRLGVLVPPFTLVGWSMGAQAALRYALRAPDQVTRLVLLAMRQEWPPAECAAIERQLAIAGFLKDFYRKTFLGQRQAYDVFVGRYQDEMLAVFSRSRLAADLRFLAQPHPGARMSPALAAKTMQLHGRQDVIAPLGQAAQLPGVKLMAVKAAGHALFLSHAFQRLLS